MLMHTAVMVNRLVQMVMSRSQQSDMLLTLEID